LQLVDYFVAAGKKSEAIAELHSMLAEDRFDPTAFYNIGNRFVQLGDVEAAISAYRIAIDQRNGNYSWALNNLGAVLFQQGRWDEAFEALTSALRHEKFHYAEASFNLGRLYAARGEKKLAIQEWRRALAVNPQHAGAARALAYARSQGNVNVSGAPAKPSTTRSSSGAVGSTTNSQTNPRP
jgi:tetratricopeptide (TPR) repeat protein